MAELAGSGPELYGSFRTNSFSTKFVAGQRFFSRGRTLARYQPVQTLQAAQGGQIDRQKVIAQMAELNEKTKLINIEYRKIRDKNRITRREEKKAILAN